MVYDLLEIEDDAYHYETGLGGTKKAVLDENDDLWVEMKYPYIFNNMI